MIIIWSQWKFAINTEVLIFNWKQNFKLDRYKSYSKRFYSYLRPFKYFAVFGAIGLFSDRWILQWLYGEEEVRIYTALYLIANTPILVIVGIVSQFIIRIVYDRAGSLTSYSRIAESNKLLYLGIVVVIIFTLPMIVVSYYFSESIVSILTNALYVEHANLLWLLVVNLAIFNIAQMLTIIGFCFNNPRIYVMPMAIKTVIFIILAYYLTARYQIQGVVFAVGISALIYLVLVIWINMSYLKKYAT